MSFSKKAFCIAALSAIAAFGYSSSAQAISFNLTKGVAGPGGATDQGAYSEFYKDAGVTTIDFNSGAVPTTGLAKYSFENGNNSSVRKDKWAAAGAKGENNNSNYLAVFNGDKVTISLGKTMNYYGIDWGAISANNTFSFFKTVNNALVNVGTFTSADVEPLAAKNGVLNAAQNQWNGYLHFYSTSDQDNFDTIQISQSSPEGGGFESDNHSFHQGTGAFNFEPKAVPEPGMGLGVLAVGGLFLLKRKSQKLQLPN